MLIYFIMYLMKSLNINNINQSSYKKHQIILSPSQQCSNYNRLSILKQKTASFIQPGWKNEVFLSWLQKCELILITVFAGNGKETLIYYLSYRRSLHFRDFRNIPLTKYTSFQWLSTRGTPVQHRSGICQWLSQGWRCQGTLRSQELGESSLL